MDDKTVEMNSFGVVELSDQNEGLSPEAKDSSNRDEQEMAYYGKQQQLKVSRLIRSTWMKADSNSAISGSSPLPGLCVVCYQLGRTIFV